MKESQVIVLLLCSDLLSSLMRVHSLLGDEGKGEALISMSLLYFHVVPLVNAENVLNSMKRDNHLPPSPALFCLPSLPWGLVFFFFAMIF